MYNQNFFINYQKNNHLFLQPNNILNELKRDKNWSNLEIFRILLTCPSEIFKGSWEPVLLELLTVIADKGGHVDEKRLASQTFSTIFMKCGSIDEQKGTLEKVLKLNSPKLCIFNKEVDIMDVESFKLIIVHGYLACNNNTAILSHILISLFTIIRQYCMTYTKHVYFSFKLLEIWLNKSRDIGFWNDCDSEIEKKLEEIIFSNWDNCINEVAKINALHLFPIYLEIMQNKYTGFLEYALTTTVNHMSWQNPTKYIIITEIYKIAHGYPKIPHLELNIFQSLNKSHLRHVGKNLYIVLMEKMDEDQWNDLMREYVYLNAKKFELEDNAGALHVLWELWMKPTLIKFKKTLVPSLWVQFCTDETQKSASYIAKISSELGTTWAQLNSQSLKDRNDDHAAGIKIYWSIDEESQVPNIIDVYEDYVRLNVFVAYCRMNDFLYNNDDYELCKRFLYYNANSRSSQFRIGLFTNFKILFERIIKIKGKAEISFFKWLLKFIFDCFELGSCYQRKIIGLKLYKIILMYTNRSVNCSYKKEIKNLQDGISFKKLVKSAEEWEIDSKVILFILLKLCIDPIEDIRTHSFDIINNYFNINNLTAIEMDILKKEACKMNSSSKFYEIAGGVKLTLIINNASSSINSYDIHEKLFKAAEKSLTFMKQDFLLALNTESNFNSSLLALLELEFPEALEQWLDDFLSRLLDFMKEATIFFLSTLSPKDSAVIYSSSFAEMGIAIEEQIKTSVIEYEFDENSISPAHQMLLSYIWMALKTLCDLAAKISTKTSCHGKIKSSLDLIVSVLMKCRHKGAIEAAGVALGVSMRYLANMQEHQCLIESYLDKILCLNSQDKIDLTRRGAGLSIMFHAMISNDDKKTRRLLNMAVMRLIKSLRDPTIKSDVRMDSNQDCVCARQLHFLRAIVADKTLQCHLVPYLEEMSMICFEHLQSSEWAIRNGSLQLLGALIPRLVGQSSESELDFGSGYSVNHFFTHYPILADFILQEVNSPSAFNINSKIVAIVTLISKMSVGGCDFTDYFSQEYAAKLKNAMRSLFGHTVDHVRHSAAKAYAALIPVRKISRELLNMKMEKVEKETYNFIHGHLMAQVYLHLMAERANVWLDTFPNNKHNMAMLVRGGMMQLQRIHSMLDRYTSPDTVSLCYPIEAIFLQSFRMTQNRCNTVDNTIFCKVMSFNKFRNINYSIAAQRVCNGFSEFMEQMYKLDPFLPNWKIAFELEYDNNSQSLDRSAPISDCIYYSLKYLREHFNSRQDKVYKHEISDILHKLFKFLNFYVERPIPNHRDVIEICNIIILVLNHCVTQHVKLELPMCYSNMQYDCCQQHQILKEVFNVYKSPRMYFLTTQISLIIYLELKNSFPIDAMSGIKHFIENGDELTRLLGIDILIYVWECNFSDKYKKLVQDSLITILSDESSEVQEALYKKMRDHQNSDFFCDYSIDCRDRLLKFHDRRYILNGRSITLMPKNLRMCLHRMIRMYAWSHCPVSMYDVRKWLPQPKHSNKHDGNKLESPFDQYETHEELTKNFNIFFEYQTSHIYNVPCIWPKHYNDIISRSYTFFHQYITNMRTRSSSDLEVVFQSNVIDYLQFKVDFYNENYFNKKRTFKVFRS